MPSMKCNLAGLLHNALNDLSHKKDKYNTTGSGLQQVIEHIEMLRDGRISLQEFGEFYCLVKEPEVIPPRIRTK